MYGTESDEQSRHGAHNHPLKKQDQPWPQFVLEPTSCGYKRPLPWYQQQVGRTDSLSTCCQRSLNWICREWNPGPIHTSNVLHYQPILVDLRLSKAGSIFSSSNFLKTKAMLDDSDFSSSEVKRDSRYSMAPSRLLLEDKKKHCTGLVPNTKPIKQVH